MVVRRKILETLLKLYLRIFCVTEPIVTRQSIVTYFFIMRMRLFVKNNLPSRYELILIYCVNKENFVNFPLMLFTEEQFSFVKRGRYS